jgi:hypothetical protein
LILEKTKRGNIQSDDRVPEIVGLSARLVQWACVANCQFIPIHGNT